MSEKTKSKALEEMVAKEPVEAKKAKTPSLSKRLKLGGKAAKRRIIHHNSNNWENFLAMAEKKTKGLPSPIPGVELELGQVSLLASVPGAGKTQMAMAMQYFLHNAGFPVGMISAEMTYTQLVARWIAHSDKKLGDKFHAVMKSPDDKLVKLSDKEKDKIKTLHRKMHDNVTGKDVGWHVWEAEKRGFNNLFDYLCRVNKKDIIFLTVDNLLDLKEKPKRFDDKRYQMILHNVELLIEFAAHKNMHVMVNTHLNNDNEIRAATEIERLLSNTFRLEKKQIPVLDGNGRKLNTDGFVHDQKDPAQELMLENKLYLRGTKTRFAEDDPNGHETIMCEKSGRILKIGNGPNIYGETSEPDEHDIDEDIGSVADNEKVKRYYS